MSRTPLLLGGLLLLSALAFNRESTATAATPAKRKAASSKIAGPASQPGAPFELRDGDRVMLLGDTFIEREQHFGWIELMLTTRFPDRQVTFRNLGWSADLPNGESRLGLSLGQAGTEPPGEAWMLLQKQITETKPTVVFVGYGMAASFAGEAGLPKFKEDYNRLLDTIEKISPGVRFVLLSPIGHGEGTTRVGTSAQLDRHNEQLKLYSESIQSLADKHGAKFVSLFGTITGSNKPLTDNGIHLNSEGYKAAAIAMESSLIGGVADTKNRYSNPAAEPLRQVILRKNEFFFHRSRPANMAYIFGFRKAEQGRNAVEMPKFDPLIEAEEKKIAKLRGLNIKNPPPELQPAKLLDKPAAAKHTPQPTPEFTVADGFEVTLWAENPLLAKPIQMNFDAQGRLWVASSEVYPQVEPGQAAHDKIIVLEDPDGHGHADKATVFADGLLIPTGVIPGDGGCYVAQSTELLHFKQTDPKKFVGDQRRTVLSGFGTEDTHHNLHTLRWGHDGRLWMNQSIYTRTETETPHGVLRLRSGGVMALRTGTLEMDTVFRGWVNAWGHQFDAYGQSLLTDGAGGEGINWAVPGGMYFTYARARRILHSVSPGAYPKFASIEIIYSEQFPPDWQGDVITCDFRAHRVVHFKISEQGAGYVTKEMPELLRTTDVTFRPIDVKLGPDGALYIADWSNPIIQHGEVDFRDPRRDHEHGRIWRVAAKGRPLNKKTDLVKASNKTLLNELLSPNSFARSQAGRILTERGEKVHPDLTGWLKKQTDEKALLQALWAHQAINKVDIGLLNQLLVARDARIRAAAVRVLSEWGPQPTAAEMKRLVDASGSTLLPVTTRKSALTQTETLDRLAKAVADEHPRVRVEALRALARIPTARSAGLVLSAVETLGTDPFLEYAAWLSINDLVEPFLAALESGAWNPEGQAKQLEFAMKAIEPAQASTVLTKLTANRPLPANGDGPWIELVGQSGGASELRKMFEQVLSGGFVEPAAQRALTALTEAARLRNARPDGSLDGLGRLLGERNEKFRAAAMRLAGSWKLGQFTSQLLAAAGAAAGSGEVRQAAFDAVREIGGNDALTGLRSLTGANQDASVRNSAVVALASLNVGAAVPQIVEVLSATKNEAEATALWRSLLNIRGAGPAITRGLPKTGLPDVAAKTGLRVAREGGRKEPDLVLALSRSASVAQEEQSLSPAELQQLAAAMLAQGDPARGEKVYRRADMGCLLCHSIGGAGGKVGPDMTSIGASAPPDYLIESILFPNAKIKEGFHSIQIETTDDQDLSGIMVRETGAELVLRNAQNQEISIPKSKIKNRANGLSLMPSGLVDTLSTGERMDLFRFLAELGKPGAFDASKGGVARLWRVRPRTHTDEQAGPEQAPNAPFNDREWSTVLSMVDGRLTGDELRAGPLNSVNKFIGVVALYTATQFQTTQSGPVSFTLAGVNKAQVWIDGKPAGNAGGIKAELSAGTHNIVVKLDARQLPEQIILRSSDVSFVVN